MQIEKAFIFGRQITGEEKPFEVIWHNSRNASPMQAFPDGGSPCIARATGATWINFVERNNQWYPETPEGFIGIEATPTPINKLPYTLEIPLLINGEQSDYLLKYRAVNEGNTITVYCIFGNGEHTIMTDYGWVSKETNDQSCNFYLFMGAGAFLGNQMGSTLITDVTYIGAIAERVDYSGQRRVDIDGAGCDLIKVKNYQGAELPSEWLT